MRLDRLDLCHADPPLGERRPGLHRAACWLAGLVRACNRKSSISCDANRVLANRPLVKRARSGDRAPRARRPIERALRSVRCGTRLVRSRAGSSSPPPRRRCEAIAPAALSARLATRSRRAGTAPAYAPRPTRRADVGRRTAVVDEQQLGVRLTQEPSAPPAARAQITEPTQPSTTPVDLAGQAWK